ncbi:MAG: class I SAM-dependent methyltransferase [Candidatus Krumholzibacteriota bacterium]|nr:class I SAM-dependent methyltransferase [Candidatus Krumholzibacteriota bacterium]
MNDYYSQKLSAERLRLCYEIAPPRVKRYLETEIDFILDRLNASSLVLELGCGYGRVLQRLAAKARTVVGIDTSHASLLSARKSMGNVARYCLAEMNAVELGFGDGLFDLVACVQNGISAFKVDQRKLIREAMRVTRRGGRVLFSSYADRFWKDRLEWFEIQAKMGLVGEIDYRETGNGVIVGKDGFRATTVRAEDFAALTSDWDIAPRIMEVDGSSVFCEILVD